MNTKISGALLTGSLSLVLFGVSGCGLVGGSTATSPSNAATSSSASGAAASPEASAPSATPPADEKADNAVAEGMAKGFRSAFRNKITENESICWANDVVDKMGVAKVAALNLSGGNAKLSKEDATTVAKAMTKCFDTVGLIVEQGIGSQATKKQVACVKKKISKQDVEEAFIDTFGGKSPSTKFQQKIQKAAVACQ